MSIRIQFDISDEDAGRLEKYIPDMKYRHVFAHKALTEWITRQEGRDRRSRAEDIRRRAKDIQEVIDAGLVRIGGNEGEI